MLVNADSINIFILDKIENKDTQVHVAAEIQAALDALVSYVSNREGVQPENDPPDGRVSDAVASEISSEADYGGFAEGISQFLSQGQDEGTEQALVLPADEEVSTFEDHMKQTMYLTADFLRALNGSARLHASKNES